MASRTLRIEILGDAKGLSKAFGDTAQATDKLSSKFASMGDKMQSVGKKMSIGLTLPIAFLGKQMFDLASDANEAMSKVEVVFGDNADAIKAWSKTAATSMGMSSGAALDAAGTFGNFLTAMGTLPDQAAFMSQSLIMLASDLASFNNANPEEVLLALRSGLSGEAEPLRKFGVSISQARIETKLLELGLWDGKSAIDANAKAQAIYALIMEDTGSAQGDFARTADGAANKQRILKAQFQDTAATLGNSLLPIGQKVLGWVSGLVSQFSSLDAGTQTVILGVVGLAAAIGPLTTVLGGLAKAFAFLTGTAGIWVLALAAIGVAIWALWTNCEWFRDAVTTAWEWISRVVGEAVAWIIDHFDEFQAIASATWATVQQVIGAAVSALEPMFAAFVSAIQGVWQVLVGIKDFIVGVFTGDWSQAWEGIKQIFSGVWQAIAGYFTYAWEFIKLIARVGWETITAGVSAAWNWVAGIFSGVWGGIVSYYSWVWSMLTGAVSTGMAWIMGIIDSVTGAISTAWNACWEGVGSFFSGIWDGIIGTLKTAINTVIGFLNTLIGAWNAIKIEFSTPDVPGTDWGGQDIKIDFPDMPKIPKLAAGGIVMPSPGGTFANIAEAGTAEAVIPLTPSVLGQLGGGGGITVHVTVQGSVIQERDLAETVYQALLDLRRRNGALAL